MAGRGGPDTVPWFVRRRRASPARHVGRLRASYPREGCLPHGVVDGSPTRPQVPLHVALYEKDRRVARTTHGRSSRFRSCRRLRGGQEFREDGLSLPPIACLAKFLSETPHADSIEPSCSSFNKIGRAHV